MALDPQARAVLELIIKSGRPPYHQLSPKEARQLFRETRPASTPVPPEIGVVRNVLAEGRHAAVPLRVYRPAGVAATTLLPGLVYFHGGGWVIGDLDTHDVLCRQLTAGNLAAVVALLARDAGAPAIAFQALLYPVTDLSAESRSYNDFADGYMLTRDSMRWFAAQYLAGKDEAMDWRASPLRAATLTGLPPALIVTAGFDPLRDEGEAYARRLRDAGVRVDYACYGGMLHGFVGMGRLLDSGNRAVSHIAASLREALR